MVAYLARQGVQRIVGRVMRENLAMRELAQALHFVAEPSGATGDDDLRLVLHLAPGQA